MVIVTGSSFLKKLGKDLTGRKSFSCSGATLIRSQRCQNDSAVSHGHSTTPKRGNHAHLATPKLGSPSTYQTKPPQNDKSEFPAQAQTSETQLKLKVFLFPKDRVGSLSARELLTLFSVVPVPVSGCSAWAVGADPAGSHAHPIPAPALPGCPVQLPVLLASRCAKVLSNGLTQDPEHPQWKQLGKPQPQVLCCLGSLFQHISPGGTLTLHISCLFQAVARGDWERLFPTFILPTKSWFFN